MRKIIAIAKKELAAYFSSPMAYIVLILAVIVFNIFFFVIIDDNREATLRDLFKVMEFMFIFIVPLLTMKVFSEEKSSGTMEFLMTTPTTNTQIVMGKYLGSLAFYALLISITIIYYLIIEYFGSPDKLTTLVGFLGLLLEGSLFIAIGIMISSWTRSQTIAAVSSYVVLFLLYFTPSFIKYFSGVAEFLIRYISILTHAENFQVGVVTISDIVYYLAGIFLCISLTRLSVENRLWK